MAKGLTGVVLVLDDLSLASSSTAPIVIIKNSTVEIHLEETSTLTDNEDPTNETSSDATLADAFEGACIKVKSGSGVTFCGSGNLNIAANAKNGIKGGSTAALVFNQSGKISVSGSGKYYGATESGAAATETASEVTDLPAVKIKSASKAKKAFTVKWKKLSSSKRSKVAGIEILSPNSALSRLVNVDLPDPVPPAMPMITQPIIRRGEVNFPVSVGALW